MRSKLQSPVAAEHDERRQDDGIDSPASVRPSTGGKLLRRIADALQVPQAVLYGPPTALRPVRTDDLDGVADPEIDLDLNCVALLHAYMRIRDPKVRRDLLTLVQEAAEQDGAMPTAR